MTSSKESRKDKHVTIRMTGPMYANLRRLAGTDRRVADVIREALRKYLDDQGEIAGSRRYFTGRFRDEVRALRRDVSGQQTLNTIMMAEMFSILILNLIEMDEEASKTFSPSSILKIAEERMIEAGWKVRARVEAATDDSELEEQRQKDSA